MNTNNIIIREFTIDDYEQVTALWTEAGIHFKPNGRESRSHLAKELQGGRAIFLVAAADRRVVGVVLGTHDGRRGWINRLAVSKDFRRQNIASKLVTTLELQMKALGLDITAGLIEPENAVSKSFFSKMGYTKVPVEYFSKRQSPDA